MPHCCWTHVLSWFASVSGSPPHVGMHAARLFGFCCEHATQQVQFALARQALTSEQQCCFEHVTQAVSLAAGGHTLPPVPVEALELDPDPAALDEAALDEAALDEAALDEAALDEPEPEPEPEPAAVVAAALDEAAELPVVPPPVHGAWHAPPTHCPNFVVVPFGAPHCPKQACGSAFGWARQSVQQMQLGSAVQAW